MAAVTSVIQHDCLVFYETCESLNANCYDRNFNLIEKIIVCQDTLNADTLL